MNALVKLIEQNSTVAATPADRHQIAMAMAKLLNGHAHIDEGEWATRPHKTHQCQVAGCGLEWRPHDYPTVGVAA